MTEGVMRRAEGLVEALWRIDYELSEREWRKEAARLLAAELRKGEELAKAVERLIKEWDGDLFGRGQDAAEENLEKALAAYQGSGE